MTLTCSRRPPSTIHIRSTSHQSQQRRATSWGPQLYDSPPDLCILFVLLELGMLAAAITCSTDTHRKIQPALRPVLACRGCVH